MRKFGALLVGALMLLGFSAPALATQPEQPRLTLVYLYEKVDPDAPASWENSGRQTLLAVEAGWTWDVSVDVPDCGPYALQFDQTIGIEEDEVPLIVDRSTGEGILGWPPIKAARHVDLDLPVCEEPPVDPPSDPEPPADPPTQPPAANPATPAPVQPKFTG